MLRIWVNTLSRTYYYTIYITKDFTCYPGLFVIVLNCYIIIDVV